MLTYADVCVGRDEPAAPTVYLLWTKVHILTLHRRTDSAVCQQAGIRQSVSASRHKANTDASPTHRQRCTSRRQRARKSLCKRCSHSTPTRCCSTRSDAAPKSLPQMQSKQRQNLYFCAAYFASAAPKSLLQMQSMQSMQRQNLYFCASLLYQ
jgi:hypothetical protein